MFGLCKYINRGDPINNSTMFHLIPQPQTTSSCPETGGSWAEWGCRTSTPPNCQPNIFQAAPLNKLWSQQLHPTARLAMMSITCLSLYRPQLALDPDHCGHPCQKSPSTHRFGDFKNIPHSLNYSSHWNLNALQYLRALLLLSTLAATLGSSANPKKSPGLNRRAFSKSKAALQRQRAMSDPCRCTSRETGNQVRIPQSSIL